MFDSIAIFKQRRECIRYEGNKQRKGKKAVRKIFTTNRRKENNALDKNVRLERKGAFIARNIEVKLHQNWEVKKQCARY